MVMLVRMRYRNPPRSLVKRQTGRLAQNIEKGHVRHGQGRRLSLQARSDTFHEHQRPQWIRAFESRNDHVAAGVHDTCWGFASHFQIRRPAAISDDARRGFQAQEYIGGCTEGLVGNGIRLGQRHGDRPGFDVSYFHGQYLRW
jgi:hypothetical protein